MHRSIQAVLARGLNDPRLRGLISVTKVEVDPDLAQAAVYVSVLPAGRGEVALHGLRHAATRIRAELGRGLRLRRMPRLAFHLDESIKRQAALEEALRPAGPAEQPGP